MRKRPKRFNRRREIAQRERKAERKFKRESKPVIPDLPVVHIWPRRWDD